MTDFVLLTRKGGGPVQVNLSQVQYIRPAGTGASLMFMRAPGWAKHELGVEETPEEIVRRAEPLTI